MMRGNRARNNELLATRLSVSNHRQNRPKHTRRKQNTLNRNAAAPSSSCRRDAEADLREMLYKLAEARLLALDRDLIHRSRNHLPYHRIESIVVRGDGDLRPELEAVGIVGILVPTRRGSAFARNL